MDFNILNFHQMLPKLTVKLREAVTSIRGAFAKASAADYSFTYFDNKDLDLIELARLPTIEEMNGVAPTAFAEANSLVTILGIRPSALHRRLQSRPYVPPQLLLSTPHTADSDITAAGLEDDGVDVWDSESETCSLLKW